MTGRTVGGALWRVRRVFRWRRVIRAPGVRYTELTTEPLRRALSRLGGGFKEYEVEFTHAPRMRIRATRRRVYADLAPPPDDGAWVTIASLVRPGDRVLILQGGTGYAAERMSRLVGPAGAVVSLDRDEESTRFAQRRYRAANIAFEAGHVEALRGETDGSFDLAASLGSGDPADHDAGVTAELWRVVAPGGDLVLAAPATADDGGPTPRSAEDLVALLSSGNADLESSPRVLSGPGDAWTIVAATRSAGGGA